jgi:hypothetical protein
VLLQTLFLLLGGHAVCDFAFQSEWVATNKNRHVRDRFSKEQNEKYEVIWPWLLSAHAMHHALAVFLITQKLWIGIAEFVLHWLTDFGKCEKWYGFHVDQFIHIATKILWAVLIYKNLV